jgi:predicted metal-dependent enzyme (double-stranded beta helix superfamily)
MADEWALRGERVERFVGEVRSIFAADSSIEDRLHRARPIFQELLMADDWLPAEFEHAAVTSGMGNGIGIWLIYRSENDDMSLFSLALEPGAETPVHDHLRWGLVGAYRGQQLERVYRPLDQAGKVELIEEKVLDRGGIYDLIPPEGDIHSVKTISDVPSVSIHLLGGDIGCIWRHTYDVDAGVAEPFRSGYSNAPCEDTPGTAGS